MSTRANIIRKNTDGSFDSIYTHWDGYPEGHAPTLLKHYSSDQAVADLLALGDLSCLREKIGTKHNFNNPPENECNAYGRDRGENNVEAEHFADHNTLAAMLKESWTEWIYVWVVSEQAWYYTNNPSPTWFKCCGKAQKDMLPLKDWEQHCAKQAA